ncbi:MAG: DNA repair protein RecO C-terminal domain-containing protein [Muribaculaceae bacterium]|nr:DNA repair protein RecO C-terminal domain-containing protein [Muribaculaceae bacterium]
MYDKLRGIVLATIKYSDKHNIVHVYTDLHGRMAFLVPQGNTRGARMRNAMLMPLSVVQFEARITAGRELASMHDLQRDCPLSDIYANPVKSAVAMFMGEVLAHSIQEQESNMPLFSFVEASVMALEKATRGVANFHICFLYHLGAHLGIQPDVASYHEGYWFDMMGGTFMKHPDGVSHMMPPSDAEALHLISRMTFRNLHLFKFNREQRNQVLDAMLTYYRLHNSTLGTLRSPDILKQLFV